MTTPTIDMSTLPARMARLPRDKADRPVPWFVHWKDDGTPDFRVIGAGRFVQAVRFGWCWVCGQPVGNKRQSFLIGPMCVVNRTTAEPGGHLDCMTWSARNCPFMANPKKERREADLPDETHMAGIPILRNPGVGCVYTTRTWRRYPDPITGGTLFDIGAPETVDWWAHGREACRDEVMEAIGSGLPLLTEQAEAQGPSAVDDMNKRVSAAVLLVNRTTR